MTFTQEQYNTLSSFAFSSFNTGFKPSVIESPNGDNIWDDLKRYAHIAPKYFASIEDQIPDIIALYEMAKNEALCASYMLNLPEEFYPGPDSTLRILQYQPGATTAPHVDFDLFTISMYRNTLDTFKYLDGENDPLLQRVREYYPGIHLGELVTEINGAAATKHEVVASDDWQYSAVFFVVPEHTAILPSGLTVGQWMTERKERSRKKV